MQIKPKLQGCAKLLFGSDLPETHRLTILRNADIESKKKLAKNLVGIREEKEDREIFWSILRRSHVTGLIVVMTANILSVGT